MSAREFLVTPYPQRLDWSDERWLDRVWNWAAGALRRQLAVLPGRQQRFVRKVEQFERSAAHTQTTELAARLHQQAGQLADRHLAEAFAHIRRTAQNTLGISHYPVQLRAGYLLARGFMVEMETGEGKTLAASLPAAALALAGYRVQVVTANDYLAERDAADLAPLYAALGLRVGVALEGQTDAEHKAAYANNICYCTGKTLTFDYLRDRMIAGTRLSPFIAWLDRFSGRASQDLRLPGLQFAIVDEADSILIDEAKTPLIIAAGGEAVDLQDYALLLEVAGELVLSEHYLSDAAGVFELTELGRARLAEFAQGRSGRWANRRSRESAVLSALRALHAYQRDREYIVRDDKVMIVDEQTGRVMPDRSWEQGLHQLIEIKEGVTPTAPRQTLARISYPLFFRRYWLLAGMSGTAREAKRELAAYYRLHVSVVPRHRRNQRRCAGYQVHATQEQKIAQVLTVIERMRARGRPVLVGARSIAGAEALTEALQAKGIDHQRLDARQDEEEATIIARAGAAAAVTIATNMAGRGTDIHLSPEVEAAGGLHVILTEGHESARVDRQLIGRCARQGQKGSWEAQLALDDRLLDDDALAKRLQPLVARSPNRWLWQLLARWVYRRAQGRLEKRHRRLRAHLLRLDYRQRRSLSFSGRME